MLKKKNLSTNETKKKLLNPRIRLRIQLVQVIVLVIIAAFVIIMIDRHSYGHYPIYLEVIFAINIILLFSRTVFACLNRIRFYDKRTPSVLEHFNKTISVVIPCYNEPVDNIKRLFKSLEQQTLLPTDVIFIDDNSDDDGAYLFAKKYVKEASFTLHVIRNKKNSGKLRAVYHSIKRSNSHYIMFIDSDGYILKNAIEEMVMPMEQNNKVGGSCGRVEPVNTNDNFLTQTQEMLYENAYNHGREYQGFFNSVLVCSGTISMYRRKALINGLPLLLKSRIAHKERRTGDDIVMTNIILRQRLETIYVENAVCLTEVPKHLKDFFKQQLRWTRDSYFSFFEELLSIFKRPIHFFLQFQEAFYWLVFLLSLLTFVFTHEIGLTFSAILLTFVFDLISIIVDDYYLIFVRRKKFFNLLIMYYSYSLILFIVRIVSLVTFTKSSWAAHESQIKVAKEAISKSGKGLKGKH